MFRSLYAKLALVLVGMCLLSGVMFVVLMGYSTNRYHQELYQKLNRDLAQHIVAHEDLLSDGQPDEQRLKALFDTMMALNPSVEVYLTDSTGHILTYSAPAGKVKASRVDTGPIRRFLAGEQLPVLGVDPRNPEREKIFSAAPVTEGGDLRGYLYVIAAGEQYDTIAGMLRESYVMKVSLWLAAAGMVFALLAALVIFALLTRRLRWLTDGVERFRTNGFRQPADMAPQRSGNGDEIDRLAVSFDDMARQITAQMEHLEETDRLRRELVANVSHDLRTPLASLQGYLETLLMKKDSLSPQEQLEYVEIAARHSRRLGRLVSELFELARLDSTDATPEREPFSLAELIQDVLQKYELRARDAGVRLDVRLDAQVPFVYANIGLIERVLENLLDNALRHTPRGGSVKLVLVPGEQAVTVRLSDTGSGIADQDLPHIFDRFYRSRQPGPGNGDGAGLGLAIARRILELHGGRIDAASGHQAGTTFTFELPFSDHRISASSP
ncbi:MAG: HAMP domain-containing sensor histidine kinase [Gammaproteobacteria bacterium]|nr:HAMP domain-containing sensor histidine kinase [Gammaproteobacteria bacterium]